MVRMGVTRRRVCRGAGRDCPQWRWEADYPCRERRTRTDRANELVEWMVGVDVARPPTRRYDQPAHVYSGRGRPLDSVRKHHRAGWASPAVASGAKCLGRIL